MQDEVQAHADVIPECGISYPLMYMSSSAKLSGLFHEGDAIDYYYLRWIGRRQWALTWVGILDNDDFQIFLTQVCAMVKRQIDACIIGVRAGEILEAWRIA